MLTDNIIYLKKKNAKVRETLLAYEEQDNKQSVKTVIAKSGEPTLEVSTEEETFFLHSKYDPLQEAERFIEQYQDSIEDYQHVFFYGIGLGYHVEVFLNKYPDMPFTMYEPSPEIMNNYLSTKKLEKLSSDRLKTIHLEESAEDRLIFLKEFSLNINKKVLLVTLPSYERIFKEKYQAFSKEFKDLIKLRRNSVHTNVAFQMRWTLNAIKNFPTVFDTPNILIDVRPDFFADKPGIIVSAGPSLTDELENLRYIKEHGLAYIFSVGSAINTLIEHGIHPDAACTYDPTVKNQRVFEKLKEKKIQDIPLVFGSSVGYETIENYPGPMFHMITNQDTVSSKLLSDFNKELIISDAPSIAIMTYQLMLKLGFSHIILVGQNLAFKNENRYAKGIDYGDNSNVISNAEKEKLINIKDVHGNLINTSESFFRMKEDFEHYIANNNKEVETINTTKGGASISGAPFIELDEVMNNKLLSENIVTKDWMEASTNYNWNYTIDQLKIVNSEKMLLKEQLEDIFSVIEKLTLGKKANSHQMNKLFKTFDNSLKKISRNRFYLDFVNPMMRVDSDILVSKNKEIKFELDTTKKIDLINKYYGNYLGKIVKYYRLVLPFFSEMEKRLKQE